MAQPSTSGARLTPSSSSTNLNATAYPRIASQPMAQPQPPAPPPIGVGLKTDPVAEREMRAAIRDLVASVDPYAKMDPEAEDMLLTVASEFIESTTNFGARLARHRGSDSLDVKDLQLHLERHHHIRVPGFATADDIGKVPAFQSGTAPPAAGPSNATASTGAAGTAGGATGGKDKEKGKEKAAPPPPTLRSKRLAAVKGK